MKKDISKDLDDLSIIMENLKLAMAKLSSEDLIDVAARLKPIAKACTEVDETTKEYVKKKLKGKEGEVPGNLFKAVMKVIPVNRFNQARFKEVRPVMFESYVDEKDEQRITFELR